MTFIDLSKTQSTSLANSFKNDGVIYRGTLAMPTSIPSGSFARSTDTFTLAATPSFSGLYAQFQEYMDTLQQYFIGSGYDGAKWWLTDINIKVGLVIPTGVHAGPLEAIIYPVVSGTTLQVVGLVNNPYSATITITPVSIPYAFVIYSLTN